jgi:sterol 3beta-glucosyltransferase
MVLQDRSGQAPVTDSVLRIGPVDHRALFPRAAAVVHHGGAGTSHAAVTARVPSIVLPHVGDQSFWADRLHRLGVAPASLPVGKANADGIAERVRLATSDRMRAAAFELGQRVAVERGVARAIEQLEQAAG